MGNGRGDIVKGLFVGHRQSACKFELDIFIRKQGRIKGQITTVAEGFQSDAFRSMGMEQIDGTQDVVDSSADKRFVEERPREEK